jgi:hypothetical protein
MHINLLPTSRGEQLTRFHTTDFFFNNEAQTLTIVCGVDTYHFTSVKLEKITALDLTVRGFQAAPSGTGQAPVERLINFIY